MAGEELLDKLADALRRASNYLPDLYKSRGELKRVDEAISAYDAHRQRAGEFVLVPREVSDEMVRAFLTRMGVDPRTVFGQESTSLRAALNAAISAAEAER